MRHKSFVRLLLFCVFAFTGCHPTCFRSEYISQYTHLEAGRATLALEEPFARDPYFLVLAVDAKHLDYSRADLLFSTIAKHPNGSRERDVGHAWVVLCGTHDGKRILIEGGHSGELGVAAPRYFDGVLLNADEPNPIRYLFTTLPDGYFEAGAGGHSPTYAIRLPLSCEQFETIYQFMQPENYSYSHYSLLESQCTSFVAKIAAMAGLDLNYETTINVPETLALAGREVRLWRDPKYKIMTIATPDILEKSMIDVALAGKAKPALAWYRKNKKTWYHRLNQQGCLCLQ
jgi:hypothetical protein